MQLHFGEVICVLSTVKQSCLSVKVGKLIDCGVAFCTMSKRGDATELNLSVWIFYELKETCVTDLMPEQAGPF